MTPGISGRRRSRRRSPQVAAGAHMLDATPAIPLADETAILARRCSGTVASRRATVDRLITSSRRWKLTWRSPGQAAGDSWSRRGRASRVGCAHNQRRGRTWWPSPTTRPAYSRIPTALRMAKKCAARRTITASRASEYRGPTRSFEAVGAITRRGPEVMDLLKRLRYEAEGVNTTCARIKGELRPASARGHQCGPF